jgi:hypothetical protein
MKISEKLTASFSLRWASSINNLFTPSWWFLKLPNTNNCYLYCVFLSILFFTSLLRKGFELIY